MRRDSLSYETLKPTRFTGWWSNRKPKPCGTCGAKRNIGTKCDVGLCRNCEAIETRLEKYLRVGGKKARAFVAKALKAAK